MQGVGRRYIHGKIKDVGYPVYQGQQCIDEEGNPGKNQKGKFVAIIVGLSGLIEMGRDPVGKMREIIQDISCKEHHSQKRDGLN